MARLKVTTATTLVAEALARADDFLTRRQVIEATKLDARHVSAALSHLRKYKAADCIASDGALWWYLTPGTDTRLWVRDERTPEARPRRPRKKKVRP